MSEQISNAVDSCKAHLSYWKLAYLKVAILFLGAIGSSWLSQTDTISSEAWDKLGTFERNRMYIFTALAGLSVLISFLDKTMARLSPDEYKADAAAGNTNEWKIKRTDVSTVQTSAPNEVLTDAPKTV